ncbi:MAG: hypothetical protein ACRDQ4_24995 [Pseudonocardiaceae bacterium]
MPQPGDVQAVGCVGLGECGAQPVGVERADGGGVEHGDIAVRGGGEHAVGHRD